MSLKTITIVLFSVLIGVPLLWVLSFANSSFVHEFASVLSWMAIGIIITPILVVCVAVPAVMRISTGAWNFKFWSWNWGNLGFLLYVSAFMALGVVGVAYSYLSSSIFQGYPIGYVLYWSFIVGFCAFLIPTAIGSDWVQSKIICCTGLFVKDNNFRFWTLASLFVNFVVVSIILPPTLDISFSGPKDFANSVWQNQTLRDTVSFIFFGNDGLGLSSSPLFSEDAPHVSVGWGGVITALFFGIATLVYFPFAFADEVFGWVSNIVARRKASSDTSEAKPTGTPAPGAHAKGGGATGFFQRFLGYSLTDFFWETVYFFTKKLAG